jgi:nicotinate-nucleotide adenylyltransferase
MAAAQTSSLGILGGTFNPPHLGHLAAARRAREGLGLERVVLMPAHTAPHKTAAPDPGPEHRLAMCALIVAGEPGLDACGLEVERGGTSFTVDTLRSVHASEPNAELTFIVGADTASTMPSWREPDGVLGLATLAIVTRGDVEETDIRGRLGPLQQPSGMERLRFLSMTPVEASSSLARERAARGEPLDDVVGAAVAGYIAEHGLYREDGG